MEFKIHRKSDDELKHYGIPGQVHGIRRFQYEDGSLTPEGKLRYLDGKKNSGNSEGFHDSKEARSRIAQNKAQEALDRRKTAAHQYDGKGISGLSENDREKAIANGDFSAWSGSPKGAQNNPDRGLKSPSYQEIREELSLDELQKLLTRAFDNDTLKSDISPAYWPFQLSDDLKFTMTDEEKRRSEWGHAENERIMWNNMIDELKSDEKYKDQLDDLLHRLKYAQISYQMFYDKKSAPVLRPNGSTDKYQDSHQLPMTKSEREQLINEWHANNPDPKKYTYPYSRMKVSEDYKPEANGTKWQKRSEPDPDWKKNEKSNASNTGEDPIKKRSDRSDTLMHYGILGMKWGVRRYQNKDGSLTKKGKERYSKDQESEIKKVSKMYDRSNKWLDRKIKMYSGKENKAGKLAAMQEMKRQNEANKEKHVQDIRNASPKELTLRARQDFKDAFTGALDFRSSGTTNLNRFNSRYNEYMLQRGMRWAVKWTSNNALMKMSDLDKVEYLRKKTIAQNYYSSGRNG